MKALQGDQLVAQNLLQVIFDGGCADTCVGKCACRDEIADALTKARQEAQRRDERSEDVEEGPLPSVSAKQKRTMAAAAHDPKFAKKVGIPQSVARDYVAADQAKAKAKAKRSANKKATK